MLVRQRSLTVVPARWLVAALPLAFAAACSSSPRATPRTPQRIAVADSFNHRVLIYTEPFTSGEAATVVLGQAGFTDAQDGSRTPTASGMAGPGGVAADGAGNLYVADSQNCRVLRFTPPFANGMGASLVLGQTDFTRNTCAYTATGLQAPAGMAIGAGGELWVADSSRVLRFSPPFSNGMAADLVLGSAEFAEAVGANTLSWTTALTFDASGDLWVSDAENNRVLEYVPPFSSGMDATLALGQPSLTSGGLWRVSANSVYYPHGLAFDTSGNLWVADYGNYRVLEFAPPFSTGMAATAVLGEPDFNSNSAGEPWPTRSSLYGPTDVAFAGDGSLLVTDSEHYRTLLFTPPFTSAMDATLVLGQPDFTTTTSNSGPDGSIAPTAASQFVPRSVVVF